MAVNETRLTEEDGACVSDVYLGDFHCSADEVRALSDEPFDRWQMERRLEEQLRAWNPEEPLTVTIIEVEPLIGRIEA